MSDKKILPKGIKTVSTNIDSKNTVIKHFAHIYSVGKATMMVNDWFNNYEIFVYYIDYDSDVCDLLFYKSRTAGYWKQSGDNIYKYGLDNSIKTK